MIKALNAPLYGLPTMNENGSRGFILNKQTSIHINVLIDDFPVNRYARVLWWSGRNRFIVLYSHSRFINSGSQLFSPGYYLGGDFEALKFLIDTKQLKSFEYKFFVGYSGWETHQLDAEMNEQTWMVTDFKTNLVYMLIINRFGVIM
jgi:putative transcriptional regulator